MEARGYDRELGQWMFGYYVRTEESTPYPMSPDPEGDAKKFEETQVSHYIYFTEDNDWGLPTRKLRSSVDPKSVGTFTGVLARDGVKIYEGDILRLYGGHVAVVEWFDGRSSALQYVGFRAREIYHSDQPVIDTANLKDIHKEWGRAEVIGTSYVNPELLERSHYEL